jgi:hypothetical protein
MFGTIRKHQTWLWAIIITLTIISFVIFFSPYARMDNSRGGRADFGVVLGRKVTEQDYINALKEAQLHWFTRSGRWPEEDRQSGFNSEAQAYQWLLLVRKQQEMNIDVSDESAARMGRQIIRAFERFGVSSPQLFLDKILRPKGYSVDDFERFVRHFVGIQEMITSAGLSGTLIPPAEAKALYERYHQELSTAAVFFWTTNYTAAVSATPEALTLYYSNRLATSYAIPERVQVEYVRFNVTNYFPAVEATLTNMTELVEANYQRLGTNAFPDAKNVEEVKAKLRQGILHQAAMSFARSNAYHFANQLFTMSPVTNANLRILAASNNIPVQVSPPFDREDGPKDLEVGEEFTKAAWKLNEEEPYSQVIQGQDGAYVMALVKHLPREIPTFEQVRDRVEADYKRMQAMMLAQQAARNFHQALTNGLAEGKPFTNICAAANVQPVDIPPFSISTRSLPQIDSSLLGQLKNAAFSTQPGKASPFFGTSQGAAIVYVQAKLPVDSAKLQTELPAYTAQLRRERQQEAFDDWLRKESERGLRDTPLNRPQPQPKTGGAAKQS